MRQATWRSSGKVTGRSKGCCHRGGGLQAHRWPVADSVGGELGRSCEVLGPECHTLTTMCMLHAGCPKPYLPHGCWNGLVTPCDATPGSPSWILYKRSNDNEERKDSMHVENGIVWRWSRTVKPLALKALMEVRTSRWLQEHGFPFWSPSCRSKSNSTLKAREDTKNP